MLNPAPRDVRPWLAPDAARPFRAFHPNQLEALSTALTQAFADWHAAWGLGAPEGAIDCQPATGECVSTGAWEAAATRGIAIAAWLRALTPLGPRLAARLFSRYGHETPISTAVVGECARDLFRRLVTEVGLETASSANAPSLHHGACFSGSILATVPSPCGCAVLIAGDAVQAWCESKRPALRTATAAKARLPLADAVEALACRTVTLQLRLQGCELDLGSIQGLQVGDVVRLQHGLAAPAHLVDAGGTRLFDAYLGRQGTSKAVEFVKASDALVSST